MSYLTLAQGVPNFGKAVISLWFRAPKQSVIAAANHSLDAGVPGFLMMQHILPLITFGRPQTNRNYHPHIHDVANWISPGGTSPYLTTYYQEGPAYDVDPSYIGLFCKDDGTFQVAFNLQMAVYMSLASIEWITTRMDLWTGEDPNAPTDAGTPGSGTVNIGLNVGRAHIQDVSDINNAQPDFFFVQTSEDFDPDKWHHLLLSFDVTGSAAIGHPFASSNCKLWYAIDDVDYRGAVNLGPNRDVDGLWGPDDLNDNAILTYNAWRWSGKDAANPHSYLYQNCPIALPSGFYNGGLIPTQGAHVGIPAAVKYVDGISRCEMAELQIFTGVTLDTGVTSNRRAFVDGSGQPVDPIEGTADDPRSPAEKLLGKKPEVLLHGSDDWQSGHNTGTLGVFMDDEGNETTILSGQFQPTAKIEPFKPEPSLEPSTA